MPRSARATRRELQIFATLMRNGQQLCREALLSGPGIERIYWALCLNRGGDYHGYSAAEIQAHAVAGSDATCHAALAHFCAFLGTAAGDQALCCGAQGGVFIAGGIVPRFTEFLRHSRFRARFEAKGPMRDYVSAIPVYVITRENPGCSARHAPISTPEALQSLPCHTQYRCRSE